MGCISANGIFDDCFRSCLKNENKNEIKVGMDKKKDFWRIFGFSADCVYVYFVCIDSHRSYCNMKSKWGVRRDDT